MAGVDAVVGLSATFILWSAVIALVSSRLVINNWSLYRTWRQQDRETRVRLSLWLSTPLLFATLTWQHAVALYQYVSQDRIQPALLVQLLIYRPIMLFSIALALWYAFSRVYPFDFADRLWRGVVIIGGALGLVATALSWWY